eukprot:TRINITY_DN5443_c0_g2_i1.p2 TRINITY_DN5443_c0_g2~~TRINITY_DN5443_c0_g2_i1.p2  ORF type:complete len:114 (+),score=52.00 TRINITY_DN5443_c0_g2_i1:70-411(+)
MASKKSRKDVIYSIEKLMDQPINVKLNGGREVTGVLKGFDQAMNLVLDETREWVRDISDPNKRSLVPDPDTPNQMVEETRFLGVCVVKGTLVVCISPYDGSEEIENPFGEEDE